MKGALLALCLSVFLCTAHSHSYLISPEADWTNDGQPECRIGKPDDPGFESLTPLNCPGPCGEPGKRADRGGGEFFSLTKGMTTFQRGQKFFAKWTRNNHFGGFVRFTLVPKSKRMEKHVHEMFAFHYSCWQAGEVGCSGSHECGTDEAGLRYQTEVQIPAVFPDGEYILGWTWYVDFECGKTAFLSFVSRSFSILVTFSRLTNWSLLQPESLLFGSVIVLTLCSSFDLCLVRTGLVE